ncbi:hypothetical protein JavanS99_0001 [Streptococcus satellite phage Javan99]|nr:hypothetical protein JavanS99_0001 [Streptococcus satellite phage Javan99]
MYFIELFDIGITLKNNLRYYYSTGLTGIAKKRQFQLSRAR